MKVSYDSLIRKQLEIKCYLNSQIPRFKIDRKNALINLSLLINFFAIQFLYLNCVNFVNFFSSLTINYIFPSSIFKHISSLYSSLYRSSFIFYSLVLWIELRWILLHRQLNINKCTWHFPPHISASINFHPPTIILWRFRIYVVPFRLRYLQVISRFSARKCLKSYFLGKRNDLSQNDLSECNKMLKGPTSCISSMKIFLVFSWKILSYFMFVRKYFFVSEILCELITNAINMKFSGTSAKNSGKYLLHTRSFIRRRVYFFPLITSNQMFFYFYFLLWFFASFSFI